MTEEEIKEMKRLNERLTELLSDPQPGLYSWCQQIGWVVSSIYSILNEERPFSA